MDRAALDPRLAGVELVAATDVDNPLLGPTGASVVFGPQKGATPETVALLEARLRRWSQAVDPAVADRPGAGAAGGLGYALFVLGATRSSGVEVVGAAVGLAERLAGADLAVTGEGRFDEQSLRGKVCGGVAAAAQTAGVPCLVLAGQVGLDPAAARAIAAAYGRRIRSPMSSDRCPQRSNGPAVGLARLAERVAQDCATME